jgi:hypothetical protein
MRLFVLSIYGRLGTGRNVIAAHRLRNIALPLAFHWPSLNRPVYLLNWFSVVRCPSTCSCCFELVATLVAVHSALAVRLELGRG